MFTTFVCHAAVMAIAVIYYGHRGAVRLRERRAREQSARVARMIWAAAQRSD